MVWNKADEYPMIRCSRSLNTVGRIIKQFLLGAGSVIDLSPKMGATRVGQGLGLERSESEALVRDWNRVAGDFQSAFDKTLGGSSEHVQQKQTQA